MLVTSVSDNVNRYVFSEDLKESTESDCFTVSGSMLKNHGHKIKKFLTMTIAKISK